MLKLLLLSFRHHLLMEREQLSIHSHTTAFGLWAFDCWIIRMSHFYSPSVFVLVFFGAWCLCAADVGDFAPCLQFFYMSWPPKGLAGTPICQRYINQYRFATLYSRPRRSPLFSAYLYTAPAGKRPPASWKYEPQVRIFKYCIVWFIDLKHELTESWVFKEVKCVFQLCF